MATERVTIGEIALKDGLQSESDFVATGPLLPPRPFCGSRQQERGANRPRG